MMPRCSVLCMHCLLDELVPQNLPYYGGRAILSLPGIHVFRPALGVSLSYWVGNAGIDYLQPELQSEFPYIEAPSIMAVSIEPRAEVRMSDTFDLWLNIPITYSMVQNAPESVQSVDDLQYQEKLAVDAYTPLGFGAVVGIQYRLPVFVPSFEQ